jgi:hypothetical protein
MSRQGTAWALSRQGTAWALSRQGAAWAVSRQGTAWALSRQGAAWAVSRQGAAWAVSRQGAARAQQQQLPRCTGGVRTSRYSRLRAKLRMSESFRSGGQVAWADASCRSTATAAAATSKTNERGFCGACETRPSARASIRLDQNNMKERMLTRESRSAAAMYLRHHRGPTLKQLRGSGSRRRFQY